MAHFCPWDILKNSANILVVRVGFVKSVGAVFHPVWEQQEGSGSLLVI